MKKVGMKEALFVGCEESPRWLPVALIDNEVGIEDRQVHKVSPIFKEKR